MGAECKMQNIQSVKILGMKHTFDLYQENYRRHNGVLNEWVLNNYLRVIKTYTNHMIWSPSKICAKNWKLFY